MSMAIARERALKGAAWLDQVRPGWDEKVNLTRLVLADGQQCVLGQVFEDEAFKRRADDGYSWAVDHFLELDGDGSEYGFDHEASYTRNGINGRISNYVIEVSYKELDQAWTELIEARRAQRVAYASYAENITAGLRSEALAARDYINEVVGDLTNENCVPCPDCTPRIITVVDIAHDLIVG